VWVKPLADDSKAVGFFNRSDGTKEAEAEVPLGELGFQGRVHGHDVWNNKDLGLLPETLRVKIPAHGVVLLTISPGSGSHSRPPQS
jgi:alpha-galactosidase